MNELAGLAQVAQAARLRGGDAGYRRGDPRGGREVRHQRARPAQRVRRPRRVEAAARRHGEDACRLQGRLSAVSSRTAGTGSPRIPSTAGRACRNIVATPVEEMWHSANMAFDLCPLLTQGAIEAIELCGTPEQKAMFLPKMVAGHVDRHDEPDRAAGGLRSRGGAHARGAARRRHLQALRAEDLHHVRRARLHREHHPPRARAHADAPEGVKGISLFLVPKYPGQCGRLARRAQRRPLRVARAQARHPREPDCGARLRRQGRRGRLSRRRGESRPRVHVHHDEPRALLGRDGRRRHLGARVSARRRVRARARAGQAGGPGQGRQASSADHRASGHPPDADDDARLYRSDARGRLRHGGGDGQRAPPSGSGSRASGIRPSSI